LPHNQREDIAAMRAQRHPDADLTRATSDRVGFHTIDAHDGEQQGDCAKDAEEYRAESHNPKPNTLLQQIAEWRDTEYWQIRIDVPERLA
jgi:hypothetical protein